MSKVAFLIEQPFRIFHDKPTKLVSFQYFFFDVFIYLSKQSVQIWHINVTGFYFSITVTRNQLKRALVDQPLSRSIYIYHKYIKIYHKNIIIIVLVLVKEISNVNLSVLYKN